jgi:hypothetical protein
MNQSDLSPLYDDTTAAPLLGVAPATLRKSRVTGTLLGMATPAFLKIGKTVRYRESDLREWLDEIQTYRNTSEAKGAA